MRSSHNHSASFRRTVAISLGVAALFCGGCGDTNSDLNAGPDTVDATAGIDVFETSDATDNVQDLDATGDSQPTPDATVATDATVDVPVDEAGPTTADAEVAADTASDVVADSVTMPAGEQAITGRAYFFGVSSEFTIEHIKDVPGARISLLEYPEVSVDAADDGTFSLEGLPEGENLTLALEHDDYFPTLTRTFVLGGASLSGVTFQVLSADLAGIAAGLAGVSVLDPDVCIMATTVTAISEGMGGIWAIGEPGATVSTHPVIDPEYAPVYFDEDTVPDPSLADTTTDGGVVLAGPLAGTYAWFAHKDGYAFAELTMQCVPGWLTNASPPYGLIVSEEPG